MRLKSSDEIMDELKEKFSLEFFRFLEDKKAEISLATKIIKESFSKKGSLDFKMTVLEKKIDALNLQPIKYFFERFSNIKNELEELESLIINHRSENLALINSSKLIKTFDNRIGLIEDFIDKFNHLFDEEE